MNEQPYMTEHEKKMSSTHNDDYYLKRNGEGYLDPTPYKAIKQMEYEESKDKFHKLIGCILRICELSGFELEEKVVLRDKKTGRVWR